MRDGWTAAPLSEVSIRVTEKNKSQIDRVFTVSAEHGLIDQEKFFNKRVASKNLLGYTVVRPGMLVYNKSYSAGAPYGVITRSQHLVPGVVSPLYTVFEPREEKVIGRYLELASNSSLFFSSLKQFIKEGGRAHGGITISLGDFFDCTVPLPPLAEQKRIVDVVSSVDAYIDALQQQVDTARTARNALLHELLSAGGDDWTETTLGEVSNFVSTRLSPENLDMDVPYVGLEHVEPRTPAITRWGKVGSVTSSVSPFEPGDVLFGRLRPYLHKVAFADFPGVCSPEVLVLRASTLCMDRYLHLLCSTDETVKKCVEMSAGTRMPRTSTADLASISVVLPPLVEQERIVEIVSSMDDVIQSTEQAVAGAKNLRSGLLSDLLSGEHEIPASYDVFVGAA